VILNQIKKLNLKIPFDIIGQETNNKIKKVKRYYDEEDFYSQVNPVDK